MTSSNCYDIAVIGGGPAGCATALALVRRGVGRILVVEASSYEGPRLGESLLPDSRRLLERLGAWDAFRTQDHEVCLGSCSTWGSAEPGFNDFICTPLGHGWHLDRRAFDAALARQVAASGTDLLTETRLVRCRRAGGDGLHLRLASPDGVREIRARFVVDATGKRAAVRLLGANPVELERMVSVCGFFDSSKNRCQSRLTMLEAVEYGWWYAAVLPGGRLVASLTSDADITRRDSLHQEAQWLERFGATRLFSMTGEPGAPDRLLVRPTLSFRLDPVAGDGWLAVGDAASSFDPICSQGIHKALDDGLNAADAITDWLGGDRDAITSYQEAIVERHQAYGEARRYLYGLETRWPSSSFWEKRQSDRLAHISIP